MSISNHINDLQAISLDFESLGIIPVNYVWKISDFGPLILNFAIFQA